MVIEPLPWIGEPDLIALAERANLARSLADRYGLREILPGLAGIAMEEHDSAIAHLNAIRSVSPYDGSAAWPVKEKLEIAIGDLELLSGDGLRALSRVERRALQGAECSARGLAAPHAAHARWTEAEAEAETADRLDRSGAHAAAVDSWRRAALLYTREAARATSESLRADILAEGYEDTARDDWVRAEALRTDAAWEDATPLYKKIHDLGIERALRNAALPAYSARDEADRANAREAAPEAYALAAGLLASADRSAVARDLAGARDRYRFSADAFTLAGSAARAASEIAALKAAAQAAREADGSRATAEAARAAAEAQADAEAAIARAAESQAAARARNAANNYPERYFDGSRQLDAARLALAEGNPALARERAVGARAALADIPEFAVLPAAYTVRLIMQRRDCLWRIAELDFVYANPKTWRILYDANRSTFDDPGNPDLIQPGQIIAIPSLRGERREGMWDPAKTYPPSSLAGK